jgi:hypothetical protein
MLKFTSVLSFFSVLASKGITHCSVCVGLWRFSLKALMCEHLAPCMSYPNKALLGTPAALTLEQVELKKKTWNKCLKTYLPLSTGERSKLEKHKVALSKHILLPLRTCSAQKNYQPHYFINNVFLQ